jgi:isoamylase
LGVKDVTWIAPSGEEMTQENWDKPETRCLGMLIDGRAQPTAIQELGSDATILLILNGSHVDVNFKLPGPVASESWILLLDSAQPRRASNESDMERFPPGALFSVIGRSFIAFVLEKSAATEESINLLEESKNPSEPTPAQRVTAELV